jgi:hypothetical protein
MVVALVVQAPVMEEHVISRLGIIRLESGVIEMILSAVFIPPLTLKQLPLALLLAYTLSIASNFKLVP